MALILKQTDRQIQRQQNTNNHRAFFPALIRHGLRDTQHNCPPCDTIQLLFKLHYSCPGVGGHFSSPPTPRLCPPQPLPSPASAHGALQGQSKQVEEVAVVEVDGGWNQVEWKFSGHLTKEAVP